MDFLDIFDLLGFIPTSKNNKDKLEEKYLHREFVLRDKLKAGLFKCHRGKIIGIIDRYKVWVSLFREDGEQISVDGNYAIEMKLKDLQVIG